jgi:hypothetical protein
LPRLEHLKPAANPKTRCVLACRLEHLKPAVNPKICCVLACRLEHPETPAAARCLLPLLLLLLAAASASGYFPRTFFFFFFPIADASWTGGTPTLSGFLSFPLLSTPAIVSIHFR